MAASPESDPVAILEDYAARVTSSTFDPSSTDAPGDNWLGVGVRAAGEQLILPLTGVSEIQGMPPTTRLPGTQPWLLGLAHVRGRMVSVVDLGELLQAAGRTGSPGKQVVLLRGESAPMALRVDQVVGLQRIRDAELERDASGAPEWLAPYLSGVRRDATGTWGVLDVGALQESPRLLQVLR